MDGIAPSDRFGARPASTLKLRVLAARVKFDDGGRLPASLSVRPTGAFTKARPEIARKVARAFGTGRSPAAMQTASRWKAVATERHPSRLGRSLGIVADRGM